MIFQVYFSFSFMSSLYTYEIEFNQIEYSYTLAHCLIYFSGYNFQHIVGNNESQTKKYVADSERDAHIGRHMNLFASGFYEPPLALSLPVAIERIKLETSTELEVLKKGQSQCRFEITWSQKVKRRI